VVDVALLSVAARWYFGPPRTATQSTSITSPSDLNWLVLANPSQSIGVCGRAVGRRAGCEASHRWEGLLLERCREELPFCSLCSSGFLLAPCLREIWREFFSRLCADLGRARASGFGASLHRLLGQASPKRPCAAPFNSPNRYNECRCFVFPSSNPLGGRRWPCTRLARSSAEARSGARRVRRRRAGSWPRSSGQWADPPHLGAEKAVASRFQPGSGVRTPRRCADS